jgi:hypothetical protein
VSDQHRDPQVRLGRRLAHGHTSLLGERELPLPEVLARLDDQDSVNAEFARGLLRRALRQQSALVGPPERAAAIALGNAGFLQVDLRVQGNAITHRWTPVRARLPSAAAEEVAAWAGKVDPDAARHSLLARLTAAGVVATPPGGPPPGGPSARVAAEAGLLATEPPGAPLGVPVGSAVGTVTTNWAAYAAALHAAAIWLQHSPQRRLTSRELAGLAFGNSKAWTPARQACFSAILGLAFSTACAGGERAVLVGGPLQWRVKDGHRADARAGIPWLGLAAGSIPHLQLDTSDARGVLVIENQQTFEAALRVGIGADLVVVWGSGYVGDAEITLLQRLGLPVGVFADLDPHGIAIVLDVSRRLGRQVTPILMTSDHLSGPHCKTATSVQLAVAERLANELGDDHPTGLGVLAQRIAASERIREQETLHDQLQPLPFDLDRGPCS